MTTPSRIKQIEITRAMRAARAAGYGRVRVGIDVTGNLVIDAWDAPAEPTTMRANPLDRLLPRG
jgi:hypothetical protein